jgi:RNA polymerase sigma-70 factor (ECF subfamily)
MSDGPATPERLNPPPATAEQSSARLLKRARAGDRTALGALLDRHVKPLQRWARGRLPRWARSVADTADLVQDAVLNTLRQIHSFEPEGQGALRAYLRRAVDNRINDELRRIGRRGQPSLIDEAHPDSSPSPLEEAIGSETEARYRAALARLSTSDQRLIVGRVELGYTPQQLALITGKKRPDTARIALHRALVRLADEMTRV